MSEHRVPMLGTSWRRFEEPVRSRDPRIRTLVAALAALPAPDPTPEFRAELRAQLVAIAPRIIAETTEPTAVIPKVVPAGEPAVALPASEGRRHRRPQHTDSIFAKLRAVPIGRPVRVATAVVVAFALLLGGAVYLSRKALPGDALYGLKRASEQAQLDFAGSDTAKAKDLLDFAGVRADEVRGLLSRAGLAGPGDQASGLDSHTATLIKSTLASADSDVKSASDLLTQQAVQKKSTTPLNVLTRWAPSQISRLDGIAAAMPDATLRNRTESSADLVGAVVTQARQLAPTLLAGCLPNQLASVNACAPSSSVVLPVVGSSSSTATHGGKTKAGVPGGSGQVASVLPAGPATTSGGAGPNSGTPTKSGGIHLPSLLPTQPITLPVTVNSCGIAASLGPIGIGIGLCSGGVHLSLHP